MLETALTGLAGTAYPIVQGPLGYLSGTELTAATCEAGGLGMVAAATMTVHEMRSAIRELRERTGKPFGVNIRGDVADVAERVGALVAEGVPVVTFARSPAREMIAELKGGGAVVMASVGSRRHAEKVADRGADALIVQGAEGGAHVGRVPTTLLVPQVVDAVDIPVIAAGGFFDGRGLVAALAYGACGIAMGTRFLLTRECPLAEEVKQAYLNARADATVVTTSVDGVPLRVLRNELVASMEASRGVRGRLRAVRNAARVRSLSGTTWAQTVRAARRMRHGELTWAQRLVAANGSALLKAAMIDGRTDLAVMAGGEVAGLIDDLPSCEELLKRIMDDAERTLRRLPLRQAEDSC